MLAALTVELEIVETTGQEKSGKAIAFQLELEGKVRKQLWFLYIKIRSKSAARVKFMLLIGMIQSVLLVFS